MAIAIALLGLNNLGRSVTFIFLLMNNFLYQLSTFSENIIRSLNFLQTAPSQNITGILCFR